MIPDLPFANSGFMLTLSVLSETGEPAEICFGSCSHESCSHRHKVAVTACRLCDNTIGYSFRFHRVAPLSTDFIHESCLDISVKPRQLYLVAA